MAFILLGLIILTGLFGVYLVAASTRSALMAKAKLGQIDQEISRLIDSL